LELSIKAASVILVKYDTAIGRYILGAATNCVFVSRLAPAGLPNPPLDLAIQREQKSAISARAQYTYVWKTDKSWLNTCRTLVVKLNDGTFHRANFKFKSIGWNKSGCLVQPT
jgi:hypothetical protein